MPLTAHSSNSGMRVHREGLAHGRRESRSSRWPRRRCCWRESSRRRSPRATTASRSSSWSRCTCRIRMPSTASCPTTTPRSKSPSRTTARSCSTSSRPPMGEPGLQRRRDRHVQAAHRPHGRPPYRQLLQDADVHAVDDHPVGTPPPPPERVRALRGRTPSPDASQAGRLSPADR